MIALNLQFGFNERLEGCFYLKDFEVRDHYLEFITTK